MVHASKVATDNSWLSKLDQALYRLEYSMVFLSGVAVFVLMLLAVVSVFSRNVINRPLSGYVDWIEQIMPLVACFGISYALRVGAHIRMDMLIGKVPSRLRYFFELLSTLLIFILMSLLVWGSFSHFLRSFDFSMPFWSSDSSFDIALPIWPSKLAVSIAFLTLCIRAFLQIFAYIIAIKHNPKTPIAVPEFADITTQVVNQSELKK